MCSCPLFCLSVKKKRPYCLYGLHLLFHIEPLLEAINTSASINQLLLSGVERMALGADINLHLFLGGAGLKCFTAYAANDAFAVLGMDVFLHCCFTSFAYAMAFEREKYNTITGIELQLFFIFVNDISFSSDCKHVFIFDIPGRFVVQLHTLRARVPYR